MQTSDDKQVIKTLSKANAGLHVPKHVNIKFKYQNIQFKYYLGKYWLSLGTICWNCAHVKQTCVRCFYNNAF